MPERPDDASPSACSNCLFDQPWWLDAVAPGEWSEATVQSGGRIVARWPYVRKTHYGFTRLTQPPCTPVLGPSLVPSDGKYATRLSHEKELLTELIDALPPFHYMSQALHYSMQNWLPFYWKGWSQTTRYTYVLDDLSDEESLWSGLRENVRREIRKASRRLEVRDDVSIDEVIRLQALTFMRQGEKQPAHCSALRRIHTTCQQRGASKAFAAVDSAGRTHAAVYVVWDDRSAYYLVGGADPELRNSGAHSLLIWKAICFAATVTQRFDFEGSMLESVERFFRSFGARQMPYSRVARTNSSVVRAALACRQLLAA